MSVDLACSALRGSGEEWALNRGTTYGHPGRGPSEMPGSTLGNAPGRPRGPRRVVTQLSS